MTVLSIKNQVVFSKKRGINVLQFSFENPQKRRMKFFFIRRFLS